jgi:hypothetical protein
LPNTATKDKALAKAGRESLAECDGAKARTHNRASLLWTLLLLDNHKLARKTRAPSDRSFFFLGARARRGTTHEEEEERNGAMKLATGAGGDGRVVDPGRKIRSGCRTTYLIFEPVKKKYF